jgi:molybdopterin/thiamine biosynthesis adenylyltransferase
LASGKHFEDYISGFRQWLIDKGFERSDTDPFEAWTGIVKVEWQTGSGVVNKNHKIKIYLPESFPYDQPFVQSIDDNDPIKDSIHLNPTYNSLCLWQPESGWKPYYTAQWLLARIDEWFRCYHTNDWPPDTYMPDLHLYLDTRVGVVLLGEGWKSPLGSSGRFNFWRSDETLDGDYVCLASCEDNSTAKKEPELRLSHAVPVQSKHLLGVWFRINQPFVPPRSLPQLLEKVEITTGNISGWAIQQCKKVLGATLSPRIKGFPLAIGYKDHQDIERWLFIWINIPTKGRKREKIPWTNLNDCEVQGFQVAPAKKVDLLRRIQNMKLTLQQSHVVIFGVGALGSSIAVLLAKAGVEKISIVDHDILMPGNVIRHISGLSKVGLKKTSAVFIDIIDHNPDCQVVMLKATWERKKLLEYMGDCHLIIDATANHNFSLLLNEISLEAQKPIIFTSTYRRAFVGRVIVRRDKDDPCLACYSNQENWTLDQYPIILPDPSEAFIEDGCGVTTEEAVALDIDAIGTSIK